VGSLGSPRRSSQLALTDQGHVPRKPGSDARRSHLQAHAVPCVDTGGNALRAPPMLPLPQCPFYLNAAFPLLQSRKSPMLGGPVPTPPDGALGSMRVRPVGAARSLGARVPTRIDALLFDLGRVVIDLDQARAHARWAQLAGMPMSDIASLVRERIVGGEAYCRHERGEISDAEFFAHLRQQLKLALSDAQFVDGWNSIFIGEIPGIRRVLASVQALLPLYAFSNTNMAHQAYWSRQFSDLLAPFRKIYVSHEIGARKPEPAAFHSVVADMGVAPDRVLFFDDSAENVAAARACGLRAVEVTTATGIEQALSSFGVRLSGGGAR
jgi:glucose-1-phosphatase